jgi:hypothetical protein
MWLKLLQEAVDRTSCAQVAREMQTATGRAISRTTISLVYDNKYPARTDKIEEMVLSTYGKVVCPFLDSEITLAQCRQHHESNAPTSSPRAMRHWRACQGCQFNTARKD